MKILIIEDNASNMKLVSSILKMSGHKVLKAGDAETGITIAKDKLPDLILMDIQLPGMDGLAASRLLKDDEATKHIPIIAMTAFAMKGDMEKAKEAGCNDYISKPFNYQQFLELVKTFCPEAV